MQKGCGVCLYQDDKKNVTPQGLQVFCLFHEGQYHRDTYVCENYRPYTQMPLPDRAELALEARNRIETQQRHQETVGMAKEANTISKSANRAAWFAIWISIGSLIVSILVATFKK